MLTLRTKRLPTLPRGYRVVSLDLWAYQHDEPVTQADRREGAGRNRRQPEARSNAEGQRGKDDLITVENGFGIRHYPSGLHVYIVQTRMGGRVRTITIGPASVITRHQAVCQAQRTAIAA